MAYEVVFEKWKLDVIIRVLELVFVLFTKKGELGNEQVNDHIVGTGPSVDKTEDSWLIPHYNLPTIKNPSTLLVFK